MEKKKCPHYGYLVKDGELVCSQCGEPSPRAKLVGGQIVRIGEKGIVCPKCGHVIQAAREPEVAESKPVRLKK